MRKFILAAVVCALIVGGLVVWQVGRWADSGHVSGPVSGGEVFSGPGGDGGAHAQSQDGSGKPAVGRSAAPAASDLASGKVRLADAGASGPLTGDGKPSQAAAGDDATSGTGRAAASSIASLPAVPRELEGFKQWSEQRRVHVVTEMMGNPNLSPEVRAFLKRLLRDKDLSLLVRNNMANALNTQERKDPTLYQEFMAMADDRSEAEVWRGYAIQFLAETYPYSADRKVVEAKLLSLSEHGEGRLGPQATVMLAYLEGQGEVKLDKRFDDRIVKALENPKTPDAMRITALGVWGQRGNREHVDVVRRFAAQASASQRVAVATLGLIGDRSDIARIEPLLQSKDSQVRKAAAQAVRRLKERAQ